MTPEFWRGKRVYLTGHTGFKGSWLSLWLQQLGCELSGYALEPPSNPNLFEIAGVAEHMQSEHGDIRDYPALQKSINEKQPEILIHFAAQALVRPSYDNPLETWSSNITGTANLLEAARHCDSVKAILIITTDKCYENREWAWGYRETDRLGGHDPYSASKACAELVTASYRQSFLAEQGVGVATARAGNVIGGGDWGKDRLIPDIINALTRDETVKIRSPKAVRPWQFVLEPLAGYLDLVEHLWNDPQAFSSAWNFNASQDDNLSVDELAQSLCRAWGKDEFIELVAGNHPHETGVLRLDASKARQQLGWQPRLDTQQTLDWTCAWYQAWHEGKTDMKAFTLQQIQDYQA